MFKALTHAANPALAAAVENAPVTVVAYDAECSFQFDPIGKNRFDASSCDIAKAYLARNGVNYDNADAPAGRSEEHTSELQSLMRISYAVFCLKKQKTNK